MPISNSEDGKMCTPTPSSPSRRVGSVIGDRGPNVYACNKLPRITRLVSPLLSRLHSLSMASAIIGVNSNMAPHPQETPKIAIPTQLRSYLGSIIDCSHLHNTFGPRQLSPDRCIERIKDYKRPFCDPHNTYRHLPNSSGFATWVSFSQRLTFSLL